MGGSKAPSTTTTVQKSEPPAYVQPHAQDYLARAGTLANQPYQSYPGQKIAGFSPEQEQGLLMTSQRATQGSPVMQQAQQETQKTLGGKYLSYTPGTNRYMGLTGGTNAYAGANPYLEGVLQNTLGDVSRNYATGTAANTSAAAARANAFGSSGHNQLETMQAGELAKQLGGISSGMRMQDYGMQQQLAEAALSRQQQDLSRNAGLAESGLNRSQDIYNDERQRMLQANLFAPELAASDYRDAQALLGVGDVRREYQQDLLNQGLLDWQQQQQWPYQQLDAYGNAIGTAMGSGGQSTAIGPNPYQPNRTAGAIGGGLTGAASGAMIGSVVPAVGTAVGAGVGGVLGLLGGYL